MGLFSFLGKLFGGRKTETGTAGQEQALREFLDQALPKSYVRSKLYAVAIVRSGGEYAARVTLDMQADGSDYGGFSEEDYENLSELESSYLMEQLEDPPVPVRVTFDMVFDGGRKITMEQGRIAAK